MQGRTRESIWAAKRIGSRIYKARGDRSVAECANKLGVGRQNWYNWEKGIQPQLDLQIAIAEMLGVEWSWLFWPGHHADGEQYYGS